MEQILVLAHLPERHQMALLVHLAQLVLQEQREMQGAAGVVEQY